MVKHRSQLFLNASRHIMRQNVFTLNKWPICELVLFLFRNEVKGKLVYKSSSSQVGHRCC